MKLRILFLAIIFSMPAFLYAQSTASGKVSDASTGAPLMGASILTDGHVIATTDKDGNFSFNCNGNSIAIAVSFVGYETLDRKLNDCSEGPVSIKLTPSSTLLSQVEITATSNPNKQMLYQPASISKLTTTELKRGNGLFLDDAIQGNVPGVSMNRRSVSGGQQLNIRGYGNGSRGTRGISSNFDGQGYKVYLNGIPVTDAEGITTFDDLDFGSVGNVEIAKGPAGTLYGLAIAGAVNLSTVKPEPGKTSVGQEVMLGNYGLQRFTTTFQMGRENASILLNYGHQKSDGFSIHNKSKKDFVNFAGDFKLNAKQSLTSYVGYSNSYDERLGELTIDQWNNDDYSGNINYIKNNAHSSVISFRAGVGHTYAFTKNISNTTTVFGTGFNGNASSAGGWSDKNTLNYGLRSVVNAKFKLGESNTLSGITGVETQRQDGQSVGYSMKQNPTDPNPSFVYGSSPYWVINTSTSNVATISKTTSLFTEWTLALKYDVSVTAGIGVSNMKISLDDRFNAFLATRPTHYQKDYTGLVSPHVAINKVFSKHFSLYAAYSKGYKAPVSSYFYITTPAVTTPATPATGRVNENLKPEIGNQYEVGTKGQLFNDRLVYEVAVFEARFTDKMTAVAVQSPASPNTTLYSYMVNGGKQIHKGVEALVKFAAIRSESGFVQLVRPFANLTYSDYTYGDDFSIDKSTTVKEIYSNKDVAGVAKWVANLGVDVNLKYGIYANVIYNYKDKLPITSLNDLYTTSYNLLNGKLGINRRLGRHFDIDAYFGATNMTNTKYYLMVFVNQLPDAYIPAAPKAMLFGGVNLKYNF